MHKYLLTIISVMMTTALSAQYTDEILYNAYLQADMSVWEKYLSATPWSSLSKAEKQRYLGYEYGYVASAIAEEHPRAAQILQTFEQHIEDLKSVLSSSNYHVYCSAAAAYHVSLHSWTMLKYGPQSIKLAKEAVELDDNNPLALTLKANIDFYCPKALGGDKERALNYLLKAEQRWEETGRTENNWNYLSTKLCIAQCYEKLGHKDKAILKCEEILRIAPKYLYVSQIYLPLLRGETISSKHSNAGGRVADKILK